MTESIQREVLIPQPREQVWRALTDRAALAEWMYPNDFEPRVGQNFTFQVPPNPKAGFDGVVHCEVLEREPPSANGGGRLAFSWSAGGLVDTRVSFRLEPYGDGTRVLFEHSGFDVSQPWGEQAFKGAEFGWAKMLGQLAAVVAGLASNDPLRENEVGRFGELSLRPNPDSLVILPVPPIEDFLESVRQQLGRDLTPQDIEIQRLKSPSIVVNKTVAEKMLAERAARPPVAKTEPAIRAPKLTGTYKEMPTEAAARMEGAVDAFGQHLFSLRNQLVERLRRVIESAEVRKRMGSLHRKEYDDIAVLAPQEREAALSLARKTIDLYMQDILMLFTGTGDSLGFGDSHAINYRLVLHVKDVESNEVVEEFDINRDCKKVFYEYYGRWLNRFGNHR